MKWIKRKAVLWIMTSLLAAGAVGIGIGAGWYWLFSMPYCVHEDCRGSKVDVEVLKQWEERGKDGSLGIIKIAGWRTGTEQMVVSISTKRRQRAEIMWIYGSMELTDTAKLLRGRFGLASEDGYCVISEELAGKLFGSIDVVGECVKTEDKKLMVAGVMDREGSVLMVPATEGKMEYLSIEFKNRAGAEGKIKRLLEEY